MKETDHWILKITQREIEAVGLTCLMGWAFAYLALDIFTDYAFGLFIWLPLVMGATSTMIYGYKNSKKRQSLRNLSLGTLLVFCFGLLVFAWEGIICMIMAAPIGIFFTWVGHRIGYAIIKNKMNSTPTVMVLLYISVPALMAFENSRPEEKELRFVTTAIEISASPEKVWKNVICFPRLKDPKEFIFKAGIAYPIDATINGRGVGAVRYCNFSTGDFVEPITVWEEPRLLKFSVVEQPEPMKELSFYDIHPSHLHGYWVSRQGQFKLTQLANGHTLLAGTTWYVNRIKPDLYWTVWSDYIVRKIHVRVLEHIKAQAERQGGKGRRQQGIVGYGGSTNGPSDVSCPFGFNPGLANKAGR